MKVLVIIPTAGEVTPQCLSSIYAQNYTDMSVLVAQLRPVMIDPADPAKNKSLNILRNRNQIRPIALASDAEWFLWVDSDVSLPSHTISEFLKVGKPLMGGWYPKMAGGDWVAGHFTGENSFFHYTEPQKEITEVDMLGLGCAMIHRSVLEKVPFRSGTDEYCFDSRGIRYYLGQCTAFSIDAKKAGFPSLMIPGVVCGHHFQRPLTFKK